MSATDRAAADGLQIAFEVRGDRLGELSGTAVAATRRPDWSGLWQITNRTSVALTCRVRADLFDPGTERR